MVYLYIEVSSSVKPANARGSDQRGSDQSRDR